MGEYAFRCNSPSLPSTHNNLDSLLGKLVKLSFSAFHSFSLLCKHNMGMPSFSESY